MRFEAPADLPGARGGVRQRAERPAGQKPPPPPRAIAIAACIALILVLWLGKDADAAVDRPRTGGAAMEACAL